MPNRYESSFTGAHNDGYEPRIKALETDTSLAERITELEEANLDNRISIIETMLTTFGQKQNLTSKSNTIVKIPETIATTSSTGMQTVLSYIATHYPGYTYSWFIGEFSQSGNGWFFIMVYDTSDLTDELPNYAWGMAGMVAQGAYPIYAHKDTTPRYSWFSHTNYGFRKWSSLTLAASNYSDQDITITTHGRPVYVSLMGDNNPENNAWVQAHIYRDGTELGNVIAHDPGASTNRPFCVQHLDIVAAGTHTYKFRIQTNSGTIAYTESGALQGPTCVCFEI